MTRKNKSKFKIFDLAYFFMLMLCLFSLLPMSAITNVYAAEIEYSNVLDDLQKDENFSIDNYPIIADNYSLQVIQIAESEDKELFIYVYQPSAQVKNYVATYINMSLGVYTSDFQLYSLTFLNAYRSLYKYKVDNFVVSADSERSYEIFNLPRI